MTRGDQRRVREAFADLPDGQHEMLELAQRGLSYAEIAAALDVPVHTVLALGLAATRGLLAAVDAEPAVSAVPLPTSARWGRVSALFRLPSRPDSAAT